MKKKTLLRNIFMSLLLQVFTLINGLIIPRIILLNFGSDINGLVTSISQFLNFISLLEGGVGTVVMSALYRPLVEENTEKISGIVRSAEFFFKTIARIFFIYSVFLAVVGPLFIWKEFSWQYTALLVLVLAITAFIQFYFSITYRILLNADQKTYFVSLVQIVFLVLNLIMAIAVAKICPEIHILKLASALAYCIQPIIFNVYVKHHYKIDENIPEDKGALEHRWDGFGQNIAYVVHSNTDIAVLTVLGGLSDVSIYAVYNLVAVALRNFVVAISSSILPSLGSVLVKDDLAQANDAFDFYELCVGLVTTVLFTCGAILVTPFVMIYTSGVTDANYNQPVFGALLMTASALGCVREPYINVANAAGHFRRISKFAYIEASLNIVISIAVVCYWGLIGVTIGTLLASGYRYIAQIIYLKKAILYRGVWKSIRSTVCYLLIAGVSIILAHGIVRVEVTGYLNWMVKSVLTVSIVMGVTVIFVAIFYRKILVSVVRRKK